MNETITEQSLRDLKLYELAKVIRGDWKKPYFGAVPYIEAMGNVEDLASPYGADDGEYIVVYFLSNASSWRGPTARLVKAELKRRVAS